MKVSDSRNEWRLWLPALGWAIVWGFTAPAAEARTWDRRSAVRAAAEQNPQVAAARAQEAAAEARAGQAKAARQPIVSILTGVGPSLKATLVPGTAVESVEEAYEGLSFSDLRPGFLGNISLIQPIVTFGKISARREAAAAGIAAQKAQTRMQRADVAFEVARIYEGLLLARAAERFFTETVDWLDGTLQSTEEKLEQGVGNVTERDVLRLETAIALARMGQHQGEAGMAQAQAGLRAYLALPADEEIAVAEDELEVIDVVLPDLATLEARARRDRPELAALSEGRRAFSALARAERAAFYPDIFFLAFLDLAFTPGRDWLETRFVVDPLNHVAPGALLGVRWQFQGAMPAARADEQRAQAQELTELRRWAEHGLPAEVRRAYEDVQRTRKDIEQGQPATDKARKWMVMVSADYAIGLLELADLADAVQAYTTLRLALFQARFQHNVALASLSKATGSLDADGRELYLAAPEQPKGEEP